MDPAPSKQGDTMLTWSVGCQLGHLAVGWDSWRSVGIRQRQLAPQTDTQLTPTDTLPPRVSCCQHHHYLF